MQYPFVCHDPYSIEEIAQNRRWPENLRSVLLIDPGKTYFCARFETWSRTPIQDLNPDSEGWYVRTDKFILLNFNSKKERWKNHDTLYGRCTRVLDAEKNLMRSLHLIAIESQMKSNYQMIRFSQHLISYFIVRANQLSEYPLVLEMNNQCKTRVFSYSPPKGLKKNQRDRHVKKWAQEKGHQLLQERNDSNAIQMISKAVKYDDPMDTVVMGQALHEILKDFEPQLTECGPVQPKKQGRFNRWKR